jgi:selenocysteine-specific elongation factor
VSGPGASREIHPVMVGTAGHIDHGKSTLVRTLTGVDPDRLKEEKERGLTIDLGFAPLEMADGRLLGMVDVPGHERFVRNMVAGSTGLDLAVLVVAADDGVMPQTREHLNIVDLLGVRSGIVALTKIDLVDEETAELAEDEVRELLKGSRLEGLEIVRISATKQIGIEAFREKLEALAAGVPPRSAEGPFRLPIQRVFTLKGIGTVVTGIPVAGTIRAGDTVEFLPSDRRSKVRAIQAYGGEVASAVAGHSTALSVPDVKAAQLHRGLVACAPGVFRAGDSVDVQLALLASAEPLAHRAPIRFHTGTIECKGILLLLDRDRVEPGTSLPARVLLEQPVCAVHGDRFLLRLQNPVITVGGGHVLRLGTAPERYRRKELGEEVARLAEAGSGASSRVLEELKFAGGEGRSRTGLAGALGLPQSEVDAALAGLGATLHVHERANRIFLREAIEDAQALIERSVDRILANRPLAASIQRTQLQTSKSLPPELLTAALADLQALGRIESASHGRILFRDRLVPLAPADQALFDQLVEICTKAAFRPPTEPELAAALGIAGSRFDGLLGRAVDVGAVDRVGEHVYGAQTVRQALVAIYRNCRRHAGELEIPGLRDEVGTSRKYLIPLLEYVDSLGMTQLRGGVRRLLTTSPVCQGIADEVGDPAANGT